MTAGLGEASRSPGAAIVLAAGASSRFGSVVKATLPIDGEPAVRRVARLAREAGFAPVVVVVGARMAVTLAALGSSGVEIVEHAGWALGRTGSLQAGLQSAGDVDAALVWPVDHPFAEAMSVEALQRRAETDAMAVWLVPTFQNRAGHPILLRSPTFDAVRSLAPDAPLRSLIPRFGPQVVRVPVADPGVVANVDTAEEYDRALAQRAEARWTGD